mgnify:CR=1 FL=1
MGTLIVLLWVYWLLLCWLLLIIGHIAISDAGVLVPCLPQQPGSLRVYAGQDTKHACLLIFFRDVGF